MLAQLFIKNTGRHQCTVPFQLNNCLWALVFTVQCDDLRFSNTFLSSANNITDEIRSGNKLASERRKKRYLISVSVQTGSTVYNSAAPQEKYTEAPS